MASLNNTFERFNDLPKELRILIWEYHFQGARLLVVHPAPESESRNPASELLLFNCTVLDSATNLVILDGSPPSPLINHEANAVAVSCKRAWEPVRFGRDLIGAANSRRSRPPQIAMLDASGPAVERHSIAHTRPIYVDWSRDMVYFCVAHTEQAFWSLRSVPWREKVRKLAVLVPLSESDRAIPFGPTNPIREILQSVTELEELLVVLVPQADAINTSSRCPVPALHRGAFGFVPYVDYLKEAGLASNHILYARTAMSFKEAIAFLPKRIRLERVVDVDYRTSEFGYYQRRLCL
ncbi:hypothetical protein AAE478_005690 [Parahypoxylon ruwenzoriense]